METKTRLDRSLYVRMRYLFIAALIVSVAGQSLAEDGVVQELIYPAIEGSDEFGYDVAIAGDLIVVGAPFWFDEIIDDHDSPRGAAFLYRRNDGGTQNDPSDDFFELLSTLRGDASVTHEEYQGASVTTDGTSVFVWGTTARIYEDVGGGVWAPVVEFAESSVGETGVMLNGTLVLTSQNSVVIWKRSGGAWTQTHVLPLPDGGMRVAFDGNRIGVTVSNSTEIITFIQLGNTWVQEPIIVNSVQRRDLSLDGDVMVHSSAAFNGTAVIFERDPDLGWVEKQVLTGSTERPLNAVEVDGGRIYIGTHTGFPTNIREIDIYHRGMTQWELQEVVPLSRPVFSIAAFNATVVAGQVNINNPGTASVFRVPFFGATTDLADVPITLTDGVTGEQPVEITFSSISTSGTTSLTTTEEAPSLPTGFSLGDPATFYDIETTANFQGTVTICIDYSNVQYAVESDLRLLHYVNGAWQDSTVNVDTINKLICGETTSLSPFAIVDATEAPDPVLMMLELMDAVTALNLAHGIDNSLDAKLDNAVDTFGDVIEQNDGAAISSMGSFISAVNAQSGNQIPTTDAADLIDFAEDIIAVLQVQM